jgi:GDP-L-fucose synthase
MKIADMQILITGGTGFLGTNLYYALLGHGVPKENIKLVGSQADLRIKENCLFYMKDKDIVFHLAANIGGIGKHIAQPADIVYDNLVMNANIIDAATQRNIKKLILAGTACSYPSTANVPLKETDIWAGNPAKETAPYGWAKRMMMVQANSYREQYGLDAITLIPTNIYGKYDHFEKNAHVIPALIKKVSDAKTNNAEEISVWGDGSATREFIYAEDVANAFITATERYGKPDPINIGTGIETPIKDLVGMLCKLMGYGGKIKWDASMPNGSQRRQLDISEAYKEFGFKATTNLEDGLRKTIEWYQKKEAK